MILKRLVVAGLLVLVSVGLLAACSGTAAAETVSAGEPPVAARVADGPVVADAMVQPARWIELYFGTTGQVAQVLVAPGEQVAANASLIRLGTAVLQLSWQKAQQDVVIQQAALDKLMDAFITL